MIRHADLAIVPWRNGGGTTREIAQADEAGRLLWRMSRARVAASGAFSRFDGMDRILTVVEGAGMVMTAGSTRLSAAPFRPIRFEGGAATRA